MPNPVSGTVSIELDRPRSLKFDFNAMVEAEDATGKSFPAIVEEAQSGRMGSIRALFYCALKHEDHTLTLQGAGELLGAHIHRLPEIADALGEAVKLGMPEPSEGAGEDAPLSEPTG